MKTMDELFDDWYRREHGWQGAIAYRGDQEARCRAAWDAAISAHKHLQEYDAQARAQRVFERKKAVRIAILQREIDLLSGAHVDEYEY